MTKSEEIVKELRERNYVLTPGAMKLILEAENPDELVHRALQCTNSPFIDESCFKEVTKTKISETAPEEKKEEAYDFYPIGKIVPAEVKVLKNGVGEEGCGGTVEDFANYFRNRYEKLNAMLENRGKEAYTTVETLRKKEGEKVKITVMLNEKRTTKNGHVLIIGEDPTGKATILVPQSNKELLLFTESLVPDEVIAIDGVLRNELFIANAIYQPEMPIRDLKVIDEDLGIAFISDMHIGSRLFMKKNFEVFIDWLNGKWGSEKQRKLAEKIRYITIAGDNVDGIGIYPGQEKELNIPDIFEQYKVLTYYLKQIPPHIHIILMPGNHDAVKGSDPQPPLPKELIPEVYDMPNVTLIGSPGLVEIHGIKVMMYHGTCFIDFVNHIKGSRFESGAKMMVDMLKRRHVHPFYGGKPITPEREDRLVIDDVPDIFHCGESHNNSYEKYRGVLCVNSGTWQSITDYQVKLGHHATPAIVPVYEAKYGRLNVVHFDKDV